MLPLIPLSPTNKTHSLSIARHLALGNLKGNYFALLEMILGSASAGRPWLSLKDTYGLVDSGDTHSGSECAVRTFLNPSKHFCDS